MFGVRSFAATTFASTGNDETFVAVTGNSSTISIGDVTITGVAEHAVTGNAITGSTGSVTVTAIRAPPSTVAPATVLVPA